MGIIFRDCGIDFLSLRIVSKVLQTQNLQDITKSYNVIYAYNQVFVISILEHFFLHENLCNSPALPGREDTKRLKEIALYKTMFFNLLKVFKLVGIFSNYIQAYYHRKTQK